MRKTARRIAAGLMLPAALGLTACGEGNGLAADGDCEYNIGFSDPAGSQEPDQIYGKAMKAYGEHRDICVTVLDAQLDVNKQLQDVNQLIAQKMDAIIVFPLSQSTLDPVLKRAQDQGIKTIGVNATVTDRQPDDLGPYDALYDQNSAIMGAKLLSDYVLENTDAGANVLGVGIGVPVPSLKFMLENYQKNVTAPAGNLNWLATVDNKNDDITGAQQVVGDGATRFRGEGIDVVMAYNTSSAVGAEQALRGTTSNNTIFVGQNGDKIGVEALKSGQLDAMVDIVPWRTAMMLIELTETVLEGEEHPKLLFGRVEIYTQDNLEKRLDWDEAVTQIAAGDLDCENGGCPTYDEAIIPIPEP